MYALIHNLTGNNEYDYAGSSVAISPGGDFVAVGFKEALGLVEKSGVVRVYQRLGETYIPLGGEILGNETGDEFGASVSISNDGKHVAVGARGSSSSGKARSGEVKVFEYAEDPSTWFQIGSSIQGLDENDEFGFSVSLSGDGLRFASGSPRGGRNGSAGVYQYDGVDWVRIGDMLYGGDINDRFGFSVSLSNYGDVLAVGAYSATAEFLENCGSVSVYSFTGSNWTNMGQRLVGSSDGAHFGWATSLSGDGQRIVVGAKGHMMAENATNVGICEVFELDGENWTQIGELLGENENEEMGRQVSFSLDGTAFSCSKLHHFDDGSSNGEVVILQEGENGWNIVDELKSSQGISPSFGSAVAISEFGQYVIVGAEEFAASRGTVDILTKED